MINSFCIWSNVDIVYVSLLKLFCISIVALKACNLHATCIAEVSTSHLCVHMSLLCSINFLTPGLSLMGVTQIRCILHALVWSVLQVMADMSGVFCVFRSPYTVAVQKTENTACGDPCRKSWGAWIKIARTSRFMSA